MKIKKLISTILLCIVLSACSDSSISNEIPLEQANCPISTMRTGTERQGIKTYGNGFECTETGSYFMCEVNGISWLLYADHGSDTIIKLCGRPDCNHTGSDCNAYFDSTVSICYYNGFLYTFSKSSGDVIRMNLDGTERVTVYNTSSFEGSNGYCGRYDQKIVNGTLILTLMKIDENGETISQSCYYKLDGSMDEPKADTFLGIKLKADGESFVGIVDYDKENELFIYGVWEPEKGIVSELFKAEDTHSHGYIGTKAEYYVENGIIIENTYGEGKKELVDTGLKGPFRLDCFPDCMVIYEYLTNEEINQGVTLEEATLYFFDWDYNDLGSVKINYQFNGILLAAGLICGETPERIILTDDVDFFPRYYINKSDFGTGNIEIHAFNVPDFGEEED